MKVHGGKKDYWDSAIGSGGFDETLHYIREEKKILYREIKNKLPDDITRLVRFVDDGECTREYIIVGFCGKLYPCVVDERYRNPIFKKYHYIAEEVQPLKERKTFSRYGRVFYFIHEDFDKQTIEKFFSFQNTTVDALFQELHNPIFVLRRSKTRSIPSLEMIVNPNLKKLEFFRVSDAFTVFQEIAMYLGNNLVQIKQPDEVPDEYKIIQHGYDPKYSFRKQP